MEQSELVDTILSKGAFIPDKFDTLCSNNTLDLGEAVYQQYPDDISIGAAGLYISRRTGHTAERKKWAHMVKDFISRLSRIEPENATEMNNMAFAYQYLGGHRDPAKPRFAIWPINRTYHVDWPSSIKPLYEEALLLEPMLWEPRYNIAHAYVNHYAFSDAGNACQYREQAIEELDRVLKIDPENIPAMLCLGPLLELLEEIELCRQVLEIDETNEFARMKIEEHNSLLARIYERDSMCRN